MRIDAGHDAVRVIGSNGPTVGAMPAPDAPVISPMPDPAPTDPVPAPEPDSTPSKLLEKLASGHFNAVADLRHRMKLDDEIKSSGVQLPEPAAPRGNGAAYQKFLAAYRAMSGQTPAPDPQPAPTSVVDAAA
jgi:hypothetical protein